MNKRLIVIITLFLGVLILEDLPYFNILISYETHLMYFAIFIISILLFIHITIRFLIFLTVVFLAILLVSTLFFTGLYSEIFGVIIYFLLFSIAIGKTISIIKSLKD